MDYIYHTKYQVKSINKDLNDHFAPWSILELFQDVANMHVESEEIGFSDLLRQNALWVLVGIKVEIISDVKDSCEVITWQAKKGRAEFIRNFLITKDGKDLVIGTSKWCLIDRSTRSILPSSIISKDISGTYREIEAIRKLNFDKLTKVSDQVLIKKSMIDRNKHLNNCNYAKMIFDVIDIEDKYIKNFEISFLNEALLGDVLEIRSEKIDNCYLVEGYIKDLICFKAKIEVKNAL